MLLVNSLQIINDFLKQLILFVKKPNSVTPICLLYVLTVIRRDLFTRSDIAAFSLFFWIDCWIVDFTECDEKYVEGGQDDDGQQGEDSVNVKLSHFPAVGHVEDDS